MGAPRILYNNIFNSSLTTASTVDASDTAYNVANIYDMRPYTLWQSGTATGTKTITINTGSTTSVANALGIVGHNLFTAGATIRVGAGTPTGSSYSEIFNDSAVGFSTVTYGTDTANGMPTIQIAGAFSTYAVYFNVSASLSSREGIMWDRTPITTQGNRGSSWFGEIRQFVAIAVATSGFSGPVDIISLVQSSVEPSLATTNTRYVASILGRLNYSSVGSSRVSDFVFKYVDSSGDANYYDGITSAWTTNALTSSLYSYYGTSVPSTSYPRVIGKIACNGTNISFSLSGGASSWSSALLKTVSVNVTNIINTSGDDYFVWGMHSPITQGLSLYVQEYSKGNINYNVSAAATVVPVDDRALMTTFSAAGQAWELSIDQPTTVKVKMGVVMLGQTMDFPRAEGRNINPEAHRTISDGADSNTLQPLGVIKRGKLRERQVSINGLPATWIRDTFYPAWSTYLADGNPFFYQWNSTLSSAVYYSQMAANSAFVSNYMENTDYRDLTFSIKGRFEE